MADLSTLVDADDPIVADLLTATLELVAEAGGWMNASTRLVARVGQLSIECEDDAGPLLRIPREAVVRVDQVTWAADPELLAIEDLPDDIGDIELSMLYTQLALHNQCGKLPWLTRGHPALADDLPDQVVDDVRAITPSFRMAPTTPHDVLFANRCFRIDLGDGAGPQRLLVPIVDLLNHHRGGATGDWNTSGFEVAVSRPFGSAECALDYGLDRDAMELAAAYGFVDESAVVAHSAPVTVEVPNIGMVQVLGTGRSHSGALLPIEAFSQAGVVVFSHVTFRRADVDGVAHDVMTATGWDRARTQAVVDALRSTNHRLLTDLIEDCRTAATSPAAQVLARAARHQLAVLSARPP